jgi:1-aminocyclopropane-1-carboxylate deaminase/D-cysteine desulfhydrase-like pyridoxal-dependent ACC family enzyme
VTEYTRIDRVPWQNGTILLKRDDTFEIAGIRGGKVRGCWHLATRAGAPPATGLITASARKSPQMQIVARVAHKLGIPARLHMPEGAYTPEMHDAEKHGGKIIQHKAGYNSVICARAKEDFEEMESFGYRHIPFGMEDKHALACTREQVRNLAEYCDEIKRIVIAVGSGMTLAGVMHGLNDIRLGVPVLGVIIGADPIKRLNKYAPMMWHMGASLVNAGVPYDTAIEGAKVWEGDKETNNPPIYVDPIYEAKVLRFLKPGDLFWMVGIRAT